MKQISALLVRSCAVFICTVLSCLDGITVWTTLVWLDWTAHLPLLAFWALRAGLLLLAAFWIYRSDRRGAALAFLLLAAMPLIYLLPFIDHAENQYHRRTAAAVGAVCALASVWLTPGKTP